MEPFANLCIVKGDPEQIGVRMDIGSDELIVGRASSGYMPDVSIANVFISRRHCMIRRENGKAVLYDLGSKHGTSLSGELLEPHVPYPLSESDRISLAHGAVILHFAYAFSEFTLEIDPQILSSRLKEQAPLQIDREKRECLVDGRRIALSGKEWLLFQLLIDHANEMVPIDELKKIVWTERLNADTGIPDVGTDELNALLYRVRKKTDNPYYAIKTVRGIGYIYEELRDEAESIG